MKIRIFFLLVCLLAEPAFGYNRSKVKKEMGKMSDTMAEIYPYLYSDLYVKQENGKFILLHLQNLQKQFTKVKPHLKDGASHVISANVIESHLKETINSFKGNYKLYSQKMMQAIPNLCFACHSRDGVASLSSSKIKREKFSSDFDFAEYNYMTRNYKNADRFYDQVIKSSPKHPMYATLVDKAFERKLTLYVKAFKSDSNKLAALSRQITKNELPKRVKTKVGQWVEILEGEKSKVDSISKIGFKKFKEKYLITSKLPRFISGEREKIHYLYLLKELEFYLGKNPPAEEMPEVLYWLAYIDRPINHNLFYSLAEIYLKECILTYTKHPMAKKCFNEYEEAVIFSFSGSAGTFLPDDIKKELNDYRRLLSLPKKH
jgi:hypothetical protein